MGAVIPSLSVDGFITNQDELMLKLFEHFKASDKSQSNFYSEVASLKYIINEYNETDEIKRIIVETLNTMYLRYFSSVDVDVTGNEDDSMLNLFISISTISVNGTKHNLSLSMSGMKNNIATFEIQQDGVRS